MCFCILFDLSFLIWHLGLCFEYFESFGYVLDNLVFMYHVCPELSRHSLIIQNQLSSASYIKLYNSSMIRVYLPLSFTHYEHSHLLCDCYLFGFNLGNQWWVRVYRLEGDLHHVSRKKRIAHLGYFLVFCQLIIYSEKLYSWIIHCDSLFEVCWRECLSV